MNTVSYEDVSEIFDNATVWVSGNEEYWYRHAWNILSELGITSYNNKKEYYRVLLYALSIVRAYDEFCGYAFGQNENICWVDLKEDIIPDIVIGEFVAEYLPDNNCYDEDDIEEALLCVLDELKYEVFKALKKKMTESDVFVWMYCTGITLYKAVSDKFIEGSDEDDECEDEEYEVYCYDDYKKMISETYMNILDEEISEDKLESFDYICGIM